MKYTIFYKETVIGELEINDEGQYKYTTNDAGIFSIKETVSLGSVLVTTTDWGNPIPFFKERIDNASRFNCEEIAYHTDFFRMVPN